MLDIAVGLALLSTLLSIDLLLLCCVQIMCSVLGCVGLCQLCSPLTQVGRVPPVLRRDQRIHSTGTDLPGQVLLLPRILEGCLLRW